MATNLLRDWAAAVAAKCGPRRLFSPDAVRHTTHPTVGSLAEVRLEGPMALVTISRKSLQHRPVAADHG